MSPQPGRQVRVPGAAWALGAIVVLYFVLGALFEHEAQVRGLLSPTGAPNIDVVAIGGAYLLVRIAVRFGVPFVAALAGAGRLGAVLLERARARRQ